MSTTKLAAESARTVLPANAFINCAKPPTDTELAAALGDVKSVWNQLVSELAMKCGLTEGEWNSHSPKAGWTLRLKHKQRNIIYLSPCANCFVASFALGEKAVQAARCSKLPPPVLKNIATAKKYAEGTAVRLQIKSGEDISAVRKLVTIKLEN